jgi:sensor histidine kinase YesM
MKNRFIEIILHSIFWMTTAWLFINSFSVQMRHLKIIDGIETIYIVRSSGLMLQIFSCITTGAIVFYITVWLLLQHHEIKKQTIFFLLLIFGIGCTFTYFITNFNFNSKQPPLPSAIALGIVTFYFAISIAYSIAKLLYRNHQRQQQLILDKKQTELTLLRNQLQPHFLFNALNNLLSMVKPHENPKLIHSFERLSQLLRYVIEETQAEKVSIQKEISFLESYIELQKLRFTEDEIVVNFKVEGIFINQKIEPGLYITFIENAFKYGTEPEKTSIIDIHFDLRVEDNIHFEIKNKVMMPNLTGNKTGIESTRKRLELIYPHKHLLLVKEENDFIVTLDIQTQ